MARFTEHSGDPQWLRDQRAAQKRHAPAPRKAMPYPSQTPQHQPHVSQPDPAAFVQGAKNNSAALFVLGAVAGAVMSRGRRR